MTDANSTVSTVATTTEEAVVSLYASQAKVYPRSVSGFFSRWRWLVIWATQLFFYGMPWIDWGQRQALLFDLEADPHEMENLADRPEMAATVLRYAQKMLDWRLIHADRTLTNMALTKDGVFSRT